ncbi:MAG: ABC-2 family transporter protein [Spirochaetales bacterium]|nr:ABC-2 family transporter protein [Spirochaetales bacterium]
MNAILAKLYKPFPVLKHVAFVTFKEWAAYRSHMLVSLFVGPVNFLVQYFIWHAVFQSRGSINGLTLEQMISYYGAAAVINYLLYDSADWNLNMLIHTGRFVTYVIRPMSHRWFAFSQKVGHRCLGIVIEAVPVYLIITFVFGVRLVPAAPFWAVLSILLGFVMYFLINYAIGIIGFWLVRAEGVRRMVQVVSMVLRGSFIPLVFFPDVVQKILFFLPFQYAMYVPVRVFTGSYELAGYSLTLPEIVGVQALAVVGMFLVTEVLWRLGVRRFTGVGV